jgi:hypothetical protein
MKILTLEEINFLVGLFKLMLDIKDLRSRR